MLLPHGPQRRNPVTPADSAEIGLILGDNHAVAAKFAVLADLPGAGHDPEARDPVVEPEITEVCDFAVDPLIGASKGGIAKNVYLLERACVSILSCCISIHTRPGKHDILAH